MRKILFCVVFVLMFIMLLLTAPTPASAQSPTITPTATATPLPTPTATPSVIDMQTGLVSCWDFDEQVVSGTRFDKIGSSHLTDQNTVGSTILGHINSAAFFIAANNEGLTLADTQQTSVGDIDFTIVAWARINSSPASHRPIVSKGVPGVYEYYLSAVNVFTYPPVGQFTIGNGTNTCSIYRYEYVAGLWRFYAGWHDSVADQIGFRVDSSEYTQACAHGAYDGSGIFEFGRSSITGGLSDGNVDSAVLYKRLLSQTERDWLYNYGVGRSCTEIMDSAAAPTPTAVVYDYSFITSQGNPVNVKREISFGDMASLLLSMLGMALAVVFAAIYVGLRKLP